MLLFLFVRVQEFLYPLVRYLEWFSSTRDPQNTGLVTILHGWESGTDGEMFSVLFSCSPRSLPRV